MVLAAGLLAAGGWFVRGRSGSETGEGGAAILPPRSVILPLLAVVLSAIISTRFSEHPQFGLALLPRLAGNLAIFLLAAHAPKDRLKALCRWWMIVAVIVAGNGLLRLGSELEFISTLGNRDFLGTYLAASFVILVSYGGPWSVLGSLLVLGAMGFCQSRGAWLALGAVGLLYFLNLRNQFLRRAATRAVIVVVVLMGSSFLRSPIRPAAVADGGASHDLEGNAGDDCRATAAGTRIGDVPRGVSAGIGCRSIFCERRRPTSRIMRTTSCWKSQPSRA